MTTRIDTSSYIKSGLGQAILALQRQVETSGLEHSLLELVKIRGSQINGCAYCLDMHTKDARAMGEAEQRIYALSAWRETPFFSDRERAALEWTEALTRISVDQVPDAELAGPPVAVVAINAWNRRAVSFRAVPGSYQRPAVRATA